MVRKVPPGKPCLLRPCFSPWCMEKHISKGSGYDLMGQDLCPVQNKGTTDAQACKNQDHQPAGEAARGSVHPLFWGKVSTNVHKRQATAVCEHQASSPSQSSRQRMWSWHCPISRKVHTTDFMLSALKLRSICLQSNYCLPTQPASVVTHTLALPSHYCIKSLNLITLFGVKFKPD